MNTEEHLPLSETSFFILLSLAPSPRHGYAIIKEVSALSDERVLLATGTLYTALRRMLKTGLIERVGMNKFKEDNRERKYYHLTRLGRKILDAETERLRQLLDLASKLELGETP
ncbi:MAG: helix-turn-helix transcriptional regulator [Proteobacteria bacterium]|nr:helix-turn-helix transcriptional regulator [Pseudomonadota bacterium]